MSTTPKPHGVSHEPVAPRRCGARSHATAGWPAAAGALALLLGGCANVPSVETPACARPAPLLGQYDGRAPGYQVHMRDANEPAARELLRRYGLKPRDVNAKGDWIALEKVKPKVIAQLRCEPTVESITYDAYLGRLVP